MYPVSYVNRFYRQTITRPANTTAYDIGDHVTSGVPTALFFPVSVANGRGAYITRVVLTTNKNTQTEALRLHLFDTAPGSLPADNAALTLLAASEATYEGYVDFTSFVVPGGSPYAVSEGLLVARPLQIAPGADQNVFGLLEARAIFTPTSAQTFSITVLSECSA